MDLELYWHQPIELRDGSEKLLIYYSDEIESVPEAPGVYIFSRMHGDTIEPLYIGKAGNLKVRIRQHFESNIRLMTHIRDQVKTGTRLVLVGEWIPKKGQQQDVVLPIIERALIKFALAEGYELFNKHGTKTPVHELAMTGNSLARTRIFRSHMKIEKS